MAKKGKNISIYLSEDKIKKLEKTAKKEGVSKSAFIANLIK